MNFVGFGVVVIEGGKWCHALVLIICFYCDYAGMFVRGKSYLEDELTMIAEGGGGRGGDIMLVFGILWGVLKRLGGIRRCCPYALLCWPR